METLFSKAKLLLCALASLAICWVFVKTVYGLWLKPRSLEKVLRKQGIKGTSYKFLFGDKKVMQEMTKEAWSKHMRLDLSHKLPPRMLPFFCHMVQKYGKISMSWVEATPLLIIADAELMRMILNDKNGDFQKPPLNPLVNLLQLGVSTLEGEEWEQRRRLISPAFHHDKLKGMVPAFSTSCCALIDRWKSLVSTQGFCELDVAPEFQVLTGDVIARTAFGSSYEQGKKIFELQKEQAALVLEAFHSLYFPGLRFIPTKKNKRRYAIDKEIKSRLRNVIQRKEQDRQNGKSGTDDLLGLLLEYKGSNKKLMTVDDLIEECKLFYFAGQETTSNWLTWTVVVLSMYPDWQEKAREEVLRVCGRNTPDIASINHLKTLSMILNEVFRLYPPVISLFRYTHRRAKIGDFTIPAGVELRLPTLLLHYDPEYWGDDVEEFKPERFAEGVSKAAKNQQAFYPFGWGPRICLGQNFATIEAKMALAMILQNFWFKLSPSYTHAPFQLITLQPQRGAPIILHSLNQK
ncbi:Cytochrome P450 [Dillenia turbinata]|uniref:Cytochrome P450 n=1 Tax=Dillenia turbinata TaxID=194707 RepID=A0AAN8UHK7_9MAGN